MRRGTAPYGASWKTLLPLGALLLFGAQGCGGDETVKTKIEQVDRCKDVQCAADEYCNGATGECVKKEGGNLCADKQCAADEYCDGATGQCVKKGGGGGGECDPPCGDGQVCDAETLTCIDLVEDLCQDVDCPAGKVCDGATGQCVDKAVDLCAEVQCPRGQCDPGSGTCVNPRSCAAEGQCLEGYFCFVMGGQGDCVVDRCVGVACPRGGVCDRLTGSCVDASPCESDEQCVGPNVVCEDGLCLPNCTVRPFPCPEGTVCDSERGICWQDLGRACAADGDCIGDHVCVENVCAPSCQEVPCRGARCRADGHCTPLGEDEECNGGIECADGEICIDGACTGDDPRFDCGDDGCPPGQRCGVFGCENPLLCERDADCLQGFVCHPEQNVCVACIFDEQCPGRQSCYAGTCIDARRCEDDEDCVGARTCNLQTHRCQPGPCAADRFEPNDGMAGAPLAGEGLFRGLTLCPGDEDWFKVFVPMGHGMEAIIHFDAGEGDLDMDLFATGRRGDPIDISATSAGTERVTLLQTQQDMFVFVHVYGYGRSGGVSYDLSISLPDIFACSPDPLDEGGVGDSAETAPYLGSDPVAAELTLCAGDEDWFLFAVPSLATLAVDLLFQHAIGNIDMALYDVDLNELAASRSEEDFERITWTNDGAAEELVLLKVWGDADTSNIYTLLAANVTEEALEECANPIELAQGVTYEGSTVQATEEQAVGCALGGAPDDVFHFSVPKEGLVTVRLEPDGWDATLALRGDCANPALEFICVDDPEEFTALLPAGDYYLVVKGWRRGAGAYRLTWNLGEAICVPGDRACLGDLVGVCRADGSGWEAAARCAGLCNPETLLCDSENDLCEDAIELEPGQPVHGSTIGVGDDYEASCSFGAEVGDVVYSFAVAETSAVYINLLSAELLNVSVRTSCSSAGSELGCGFAGEPALSGILDEGSYFLIVDSPDGEAEFDISVEVTPLACIPGDRRCQDDMLQTCVVDERAEGMARFDQGFLCDGGCAGGFCVNANDGCAGALPLLPAAIVSGTTIGAQNDGNPTCDETSYAADLVYTFTLEQTMGVELAMAADLETYVPIMHVRKGACELQAAEVACAPSELFWGIIPIAPPSYTGVLEAGTYYVYVDGMANPLAGTSDSEGAFGLWFDTYELACNPLEEPVCDGEYLLGCSPDGLEALEVRCPNGCQDGRCIVANDTCAGAIALELPAQSVDGDSSFAADDAVGNACFFVGGGADVFYSFTLPSAKAVDIQLHSEWDNQLIVRRGSCEAGDRLHEVACLDDNVDMLDLGEARFQGVLGAGRYWIVVDGFQTTGGPFTLDFAAADPVCRAGARRCDPERPDQPQVCAGGRAWEDEGDPCAAGCDAGICNPVVVPGESCDAPLPLVSGETVEGSTEEAIDDYQHDSGFSCAWAGGEGADQVYSFTLEEEALVRLAVDTGRAWDATLDLRGGGCGEEALLACADDPEEIVELLPAGEYFVIVDGFGLFSGGEYTLSFETLPIICEVGAARCADDGGVEVCENGVEWVAHHPCPGPCVDGRCQHANDRCGAAALPLVMDEPVEGTTFDARNDYAGNCVVGLTGDVAYTFTLDATTGVAVELLPEEGFFAHFFIRKDCAAPASEVACTEPDDSGWPITWQGVLGAGTYYVVVDGVGIDAGMAGSFTLTLSSYALACNPLERPRWCEGTVQRSCSADGLFIEAIECPGACVNDTCLIENEACAGAQPLVAGGWVSGDLRVAAPDYRGSCGGTGNDVVYTFTVPEGGQGVRLLLEAVSGSPILHLRRGACAEPQGHRAEVYCGGSAAGPLDAGVYYVVVDADRGDEGEFGLKLETYEVICEPEASECLAQDDGSFVFRRCNEEGSALSEEACAQGCDPEAGCLLAGDGCDRAIPLELGVEVEGDTTDYAADYSHPMHTACRLAGGAAGRDIVYTFSLEQETTVHLQLTVAEVWDEWWWEFVPEWDATLDLRRAGCAEEDIVYCGDDPEEFTRTLPAGQYFVVVDGYGSWDYGSFTLLVESAEPPPVCEAGQLFCTEENQIARCSDDGLSFEVQQECGEQACTLDGQGGAACVGFCDVAVELAAGQQAAGTLVGAAARFTRTCAGRNASRPEALYRFTLASPAQVELVATPTGDWDAVLEVRAADCRDGGDVLACRDWGSDGDAEEYSSTLEAGTYYVLVEGYGAADVGEFTLDLTVQELACDPGSQWCEGNVPWSCDWDGMEKTAGDPCLASACVDGACAPICEAGSRWCEGNVPWSCSDDGMAKEQGEACAVRCNAGWCSPDNDSCAAATELVDGETVEGNTYAAANDAVGSCAFGNAGDAVYSFTVGADEVVLIQLEADFDAYFYVRRDCAAPASELLCEAEEGRARLVLDPGTYYLFVDGRAGGWGERRGAYQLTMSKVPAPLDCADPGVLAAGDNAGTLLGKPTDLARPSCTSRWSDDGPDDIWQLVLAEDADVTLTLRADGFWDPVIAIYGGDCAALAGGVEGEQACNDEPEMIEAGLRAGTYWVVVTTYGDGEDAAGYTLSLEQRAVACEDGFCSAFEDCESCFADCGACPQDCAHPGELQDGDNVGDTSSTAADVAWPSCADEDRDGNDEVWAFTPDCNGTVYLELGLPVDDWWGEPLWDAVLALYEGSCGELDAELGCNDAWWGETEALEQAVTAGTTYYVVVSGYSDRGSGEYTLSSLLECAPPPVEGCPDENDLEEDADPIQVWDDGEVGGAICDAQGDNLDDRYAIAIPGSTTVTISVEASGLPDGETVSLQTYATAAWDEADALEGGDGETSVTIDNSGSQYWKVRYLLVYSSAEGIDVAYKLTVGGYGFDEAADPQAGWGFEQAWAPENNGDPPGFKRTASSTGFTATQVAAPVHGGNAAVRLSWTSTSNQDLYQDQPFPVVPGRTYTLAYWAQDDDPAGQIRAALKFYDKNNAAIAAVAPDSDWPDGYTADNPDWAVYRHSRVAPAGAAYAKGQLRMYDVAGSWVDSATVTVDDWSLAEEQVD